MAGNAFDEQSEFLRSEKDTRPYWETQHRALALPLIKSGYNDSVSYGVPGILGGSAWGTIDDILRGRPVAKGEVEAAAGEAAGAAMTGAFAAPRPKGSIGMAGREQPAAPSRELDPLGFYSQALETAKTLQPKGTIDQYLGAMRNKGVKQAEIDATGVANAFEGRPVTRDELADFLRKNRVTLNESLYSDVPAFVVRLPNGKVVHTTEHRGSAVATAEAFPGAKIIESFEPTKGETTWSRHSLDPENMSYRERVLHMPMARAEFVPHPTERGKFAIKRPDGSLEAYPDGKPRAFHSDSPEIIDNIEKGNGGRAKFQSGHFPEPNIVGHTQSSIGNLPDGRTAQILDQVQSDWGQRLRKNGVFDEAKIADLRRQGQAIKDEQDAIYSEVARIMRDAGADHTQWGAIERFVERGDDAAKRVDALRNAHIDAGPKLRMIEAELKTALAATPGHPLVNNTDQWLNTLLRRSVRNAIDANADTIAIPSGSTVLSYNPGKEHGMNAFYNDVVPKNLAAILGKLDRDGLRRQIIEQITTPSGPAGQGFTVFDITPKMREEARKGLPMFSRGIPVPMPVAAPAPYDPTIY